MIAAILLSAAASTGAFLNDFPGALVVKAPGSGAIASASGFKAKGFGETPGKAATAFLARYGSAFGLAQGVDLEVRGEPAQGRAGAVRIERRIDKLPVFDADVTVGVDPEAAITSVHAAQCPRTVERKVRISQARAVALARKSAGASSSDEEPNVTRGFKVTVGAVRPVWRIDLSGARGEVRVDVDAATGRVLSKQSLRFDGQTQTRVGPAPSLGPGK